MAKKKHPPVSVEEARRGIYIDFEGGGAVRRAFLGVLWLDGSDKVVFRQCLFDEALWPMTEESNSEKEGFWERADLTDTLEELRQLAEVENRLVFAYSIHERKMIKEHLEEGELLNWWLKEQNLVNAKQIAKTWKTLNHPKVKFPPKKGQKKEWHSLQNYLDLISYEVPSEYGPGVVASAIDQVRRELIKTDGGPLSEEAASAWDQAVMHNFHDCCGMRELVITCTKAQSLKSNEAQQVAVTSDPTWATKPVSAKGRVPVTGFNQHTAESRGRFEKSRPGLLAEYPRAYLRWDVKEDEYLKGLHHQGCPVEEIAKNLGRNHGAIYARLEKLGLQKRLD